MKKILSSLNTTGESDMKDEFDGFVGWGEGIRSAEDVDFFDERPDL